MSTVPDGPPLETALLASIPFGLYVLDADWRFLFLNPMAERFFEQVSGHTREQLLGKSIREECPEVADSTFAREYHEALAEQRTFELEVYYPTLDRWFAIVAPATEDLRCVYFQDITARNRLERELRLRMEQLLEADRGKDEFLLHLTHEVRNALAPIRNAHHLLADGGGDLQEARALAEHQVDYLSRLMEDLLQAVRLTTGRVGARKEPFDVANVIARVTQGVLCSAEGRGRNFKVHLPDEPLFVQADPQQVEEVLRQLVDNATRYTRAGGEICLGAERAGDQVVLRVRDDGIGIAPEVLPRLFHLFMRGDRPLGRTQGGLGIGLTLVRKLVEMQGGSVAARSDGPGWGSEFIVHLPALDRPSPADVSCKDEGAGTAGRILVVDNVREVAHSVALLLKDWGYAVRIANDGAWGLREAKRWRPGAVLLDIGMPGMDGYEVARQLRQLKELQPLVLIALTGFGEDEDRRRAKQAGFDFHLIKPVSPQELKDLLAAVMPPATPEAAVVSE